MNDSETLLAGIEFKIRKLLNLQKKLLAENSQLLLEKKELLKNIELQTIKLKDLEDKNKIIRIGKKLETSKDTRDIKLKINEIVREVDKCVSLLTK